MKRNIFYIILAFCISTMFLLTPFSVDKKSVQNLALATEQSDQTNSLSIFIKKPLFSTIYNDIIYFVDKESSGDLLLKKFHTGNKIFEQDYLNLSKYTFLKAISNENLMFALVTVNEQPMLIRINLETFEVSELEIDDLTTSHTEIYVTTINIGGIDHYLVSLTPNEPSETILPLIAVVSCDTFSLVSCSSLKFDTSATVAQVKNNLIKFFAFPLNQSAEITEFYIVFFYDKYVSYSKFSKEKLILAEIEVNTTTPFNLTLDNSIYTTTIGNIDIINFNNMRHFIITYHKENEISTLKLYHMQIGDDSDTKFECTFETSDIAYNNSIILTNADYIIFSKVDDLKGLSIIARQIKFDEYQTTIGTDDSSSAFNPPVEETYFTENNFIYKKVLKTTPMLEKPWESSPIVNIPADAHIIQIGTGTIKHFRTVVKDYVYCMYSADNKNYLGYVSASSEFLQDLPDIAGKKTITVTDGTNLYSLPTVVVNNTLVAGVLSSNIITKIPKETKVEIIDTLGGYTANGCTLVKVSVNDTTGFINANKIIDPQEYVDFIVTNSAIKKDNTAVYSDASQTSQVKDFLNKNKMVRIDGARDTKTGLTHITYNDENGNVLSGYIVTDYIESDSWSTLQIVGCVLIAINIGLLILILYFKKHHIGKDGQKYDDSKKPNYKEQ